MKRGQEEIIQFAGRGYVALSGRILDEYEEAGPGGTYQKAYDPRTEDSDGFCDAVMIYRDALGEIYQVDIYAAYHPITGIC